MSCHSFIHIAVCSNVLQCVAACFGVLQCVYHAVHSRATTHERVAVAACCSVMSCHSFIHIAVCSNVLQCVAVCCSVLQCVAVCVYHAVHRHD